MLKNGLNTEVLSTATIKLRKLEEKKLTRHKLSNKQSFKLSTILDRKIIRNPEKNFAMCERILAHGIIILMGKKKVSFVYECQSPYIIFSQSFPFRKASV